jgi:transposase
MSTSVTQDTESTNRPLFLAFELSNSQWKLGSCLSLGQKPREVNIPAGDLARLHQELSAAKKRFSLATDAPVLSCYEAGRDGFWLHRHLEKVGVHNVIVDPASVAVNRRARRAKTDRLDVRMLLKHLVRSQDDEKEWSVVRVPSVEEEDHRHLQRELETLKGEKTQHTNRIKSLLVLHGLRSSVNRKFLQRLREMRQEDGSPLPPQLVSRLEREYARWMLVVEQIDALYAQRRLALREGQDPLPQKARRLMRLRGIGEHGGWQLSSELFSWREFANRRQLGSFSGLTPTPHKSGGLGWEQGIDKAGNTWIRPTLIQLAWGWLRFQPQSDLSRWFQERFGPAARRTRRVGIVALARKLLIALWHFVEHGVVPAGAVLKPSTAS